VDAEFSDEWKKETFGKTYWWSLPQFRKLNLKLTLAVWDMGNITLFL